MSIVTSNLSYRDNVKQLICYLENKRFRDRNNIESISRETLVKALGIFNGKTVEQVELDIDTVTKQLDSEEKGETDYESTYG